MALMFSLAARQSLSKQLLSLMLGILDHPFYYTKLGVRYRSVCLVHTSQRPLNHHMNYLAGVARAFETVGPCMYNEV